ncbi:hypothetical protein FHT78_000078 [Rhizobium sp. BK196]|jgi:hypothetical protein|uniref:hypothetical protein n=1 Tax=Rhizobium sp. BK196 TaxID=2587073 RepID=UPI0016180BFE|nr:hypothetical protein [Rhizobium sp. BK196]MBB3308349.1 hypothetical protein [Rhizobium sp. BK196]
MLPDFSKSTIDTLAKRAGFICSNPDCRVSTVGPNAESSKYTTIGEAAHICGARPNSARYNKEMSDSARGEITNAIWLCSNCHTQIDRDPARFPVAILFAWREEHDKFVAVKLGTPSDRIRAEIVSAQLDQFKNYPPIVRRIAADKPIGWEWRLTAELLRYLNRPAFRQLHDLTEGLYTRPTEIIEDNAITWIRARLTEMETLVPPLEKLLSRLSHSWGPPRQEGDISEIHHICLLIKQALEQIVRHEERLLFVDLPGEYRPILGMLRDCLGSQAHKLADLPSELEAILALVGTDNGGTAEEPLVLEKTITFELPPDWENHMRQEIAKLAKIERKKHEYSGSIFGYTLIIFVSLCVIYSLLL